MPMPAPPCSGRHHPDEFDRALQPRLAQARTAQQNNDYWLYNVMVGMEQYPQLLDEARTH